MSIPQDNIGINEQRGCAYEVDCHPQLVVDRHQCNESSEAAQEGGVIQVGFIQK
ncbi:MAG: hypothetical protein K6U11_11280 [bacterium]|nr:hypothetical protein [bacterium]